MRANPRNDWGFAMRNTRKAKSGGVGPSPDAANLRVFADSLDVDGSGNSTMVDGAAVPSWSNRGTLGGTLAQGVTGAQPTFRASGLGAKPIVDFDGGDSLLSSLPASAFTFMHDGVTGCTIYSVVRTTTSAVQTIAATSSGPAANIGVGHRYSTGFAASFFMTDGSALRVNASGAAASVTNGSYDVMCSTLSSSATPNAAIYVNGTSVATAASAAFVATDPTSTLCIGGTPSNTFRLLGQLSELMIFAGVHDSVMRASVLAWLAARRGGVTFPVAA